MSDKPSVLARLFRRPQPAAVVSSLAQAALNRPILALPAMAESVIAGYLSGEITSVDSQLATERVPLTPASAEVETTGAIGVLSISGALVNRAMPGPSGGGPTSYAAVRDAFDDLLHDEGVSAIVLRIESPGGMASGCFDLTDHIFASRGVKPIHCLVDDYAYSGAYAIAAACDEIWVSRTGGVGSVGVCAFHYDWSAGNEQMGLKVTPIFAGARKVDLNPNLPLSDEAKASAQTSINQTFDLFNSSVAQYRGVDVSAILATDADTFHGAQAVASGLATRLGTWDDLVAHLGSPGVEAPEQTGDPDSDEDGDEARAAALAAEAAAAPLAPEVEAAPIDVAALAPTHADMVAAVSASTLAPAVKLALFETVSSPDQTSARIEHAQAVIDACTAAGVDVGSDRAAAFVRSNTPIAQVRSELVEAKAKASDAVELQTTLPAVTAAKPTAASALDPTAIYRKRGSDNG